MMKKQRENTLFWFGITAIFVCNVNICAGQNDVAEIAYYNNPDIISNRLQEQENNSTELSLELLKNTKIVFAEQEQAQEHLSTKDDYIKSMSLFDMKVRLKKEEPVSEKEYLDFIGEQAMQWTDSEKYRVTTILKNIAYRLKDYDMNFPNEILLIKTTGKEEGGAAYCRRNAIIIPQTMLRQYGFDLEYLFIHELLHIFFNHNPQLIETFYGLINFKKCENVELPPKLLEIEITNPDVPKNEYYIELEYGGETICVIPFISLPDFDIRKGGEFFRYLNVNLLAIEQVNNNWRYKRDNNNEPVLYETRDVPDYFNKIGENTSYVIHPEEILAENFVLMVQEKQPVKSKWVIDKMKSMLENKNKKGVGIN